MTQTPTAPFGTLPSTAPVRTSPPVEPPPTPLRRRLRVAALTLAAATLFVVLAVVTVRRLAHGLDVAVGERLGPARASAVGVLAAVLGCGCTGLLTLTMLDVPVQQLLLGGVVTGVVVGIAAQQTLANLLAGGVLMMARPFTGVVPGAGLTYVRVRTEEGVLQLPSSALVTAAIVASPTAVGPRHHRCTRPPRLGASVTRRSP